MGCPGHREGAIAKKKSTKILLVEDDPVARAELQARLEASDYTVAWAADAASVVTVVNRESPDVILLDIGLPAGDGFLVMERLKKIPRFAAIPVLVVTGRDDPQTAARATALGAAAFLRKPVDNAALLAAIRAALE